MSKSIFEEGPAPNINAAPANGSAVDKIKKQARQLAYDIRYKVKSRFPSGQKTDASALQRAYQSELAKSKGSGPVKAMAKKMLSLREEYDMDELVNESILNALKSVFVENTNILNEDDEVFKIYVYDPKTKTSYRRRATRQKMSELRSKGLKVEITKYGIPYEGELQRGEQTAKALGGGKKKAKPDYLDFDHDNNKREPMKKALKDKKKQEMKEDLKGNQKVLDKNNNDKIDSDDFRLIRKEKNQKNIKEEKKINSSSDLDKKITGNGVNNRKRINLNPTLSNVQTMEQTSVNPNLPVAQKPTQNIVGTSANQKGVISAQKRSLAARKSEIQAQLQQLGKGQPLGQLESYEIISEKSVSKHQHRAAGAAYNAKKTGDSSGLQGASLQMFKSMSLNQLRDFAKTKEKNLPSKVTEQSIEECDMPNTDTSDKKNDKRSKETTDNLVKNALRSRGLKI